MSASLRLPFEAIHTTTVDRLSGPARLVAASFGAGLVVARIATYRSDFYGAELFLFGLVVASVIAGATLTALLGDLLARERNAQLERKARIAERRARITAREAPAIQYARFEALHVIPLYLPNPLPLRRN